MSKKICKTPEELSKKISYWHERPHLKIISTNGCFDIIHAAHLKILKYARSLGDVLVVGINSDSSIKKLKGENRPVYTEMERARFLAELDWVDFVYIFHEENPVEFIKIAKPDFHVKDSSYADCIEKEALEAIGSKLVLFKKVDSLSTTEIICRIINQNNRGNEIK